MSSNELIKGFEPWYHSFYFNGIRFGTKDNIVASKLRVEEFYTFFTNSKRILELGSLEGSDSFYLAKKQDVKVIAIEARRENINKSEFLRKHYSLDNIIFIQEDLDEINFEDFDDFDAVLCCGILYHLKEPWKLIQKLSKITNNLYLWTHYWGDNSLTEIVSNYRVKRVNTFSNSPNIRAISNYTYWLTYESLINLLRENGFSHFHKVEKSVNQFEDERICFAKLIVSKIRQS